MPEYYLATPGETVRTLQNGVILAATFLRYVDDGRAEIQDTDGKLLIHPGLVRPMDPFSADYPVQVQARRISKDADGWEGAADLPTFILPAGNTNPLILAIQVREIVTGSGYATLYQEETGKMATVHF